jgi:hypothetical protein
MLVQTSAPRWIEGLPILNLPGTLRRKVPSSYPV